MTTPWCSRQSEQPLPGRRRGAADALSRYRNRKSHYQTRDMVALVARIFIGDVPVDVYVTHLFMSRGDDSLRLFQVQQLLALIDSRSDVAGSIVCGDFNASLDAPSAALMATRFRPTQLAPTAFTALTDTDGSVSHPYWPRMDRCIDYIRMAGAIDLIASGLCFDKPSPADPTLWPSDHAGVWADLEIYTERGTGFLVPQYAGVPGSPGRILPIPARHLVLPQLLSMGTKP